MEVVKTLFGKKEKIRNVVIKVLAKMNDVKKKSLVVFLLL